MEKLLKILFRIDVALLIISVGICLIGLFPFGNMLTNYFTKEYFIKKIVKVEGKDTYGDGFTTLIPYCIVDNERINISATKELTIDKYYYVWFNRKTKHAYLTNKNSETYDIFSFGPGTIMLIVAFCLSILFYLNMLFLRRKIIDIYGKESL